MKRKLTRSVIIFLASVALYFIGTLPFHNIFSVFTATEVRPAAVLNPFLGINFGIPAALGITVANFISDCINGYTAGVLIEGVILQFIYTFVPYIMWRALVGNEEHRHRLDSVERMLKFFVCVLAYAVVSSLGVGFVIWSNYGADFVNTSFFVFLNNFTMAMVLGCPLMIVANLFFSRLHGAERRISAIEKMIIAAAVIEVVIIAVIIAAVTHSMPGAEVYDVWNRIFIMSVAVINAFMALTLLVMILYEKRRAGNS